MGASISTSPTRFPALGTWPVLGKRAGKSGLAFSFGGGCWRAGDMSGIFRRTHPSLAGLCGKSALVNALGNIAKRSFGFLCHLIPLSTTNGAALGFPGIGKGNSYTLLLRSPRFSEFAYVSSNYIPAGAFLKWHFILLPTPKTTATARLSASIAPVGCRKSGIFQAHIAHATFSHFSLQSGFFGHIR